MTKKILAFGASNSSTSINKQLATYAALQVPDASVNVLDLNDFEMPIYSSDREKASGIPDLARQFMVRLKDADGFVISFAEHNGAYSTAFKNIFDWVSRIEQDIWENKPMFLLSTSPGARGGRTVLDIALNKFKFMNTNTIAGFALPSFYDNISAENGIKDKTLAEEFNKQLKAFTEAF